MKPMTKAMAKEILDLHRRESSLQTCSTFGQVESKLSVGDNKLLDGLNRSDKIVIEAALVLAGFKIGY